MDSAANTASEMNNGSAGTDRAAILAARKERKAAAKAAKKDKSARPRRGPSRKGCGVPPAVVDAIDALELGPVSVEVAPHSAAAKAFAAATAKHRRTFQTTNRATHQLQIESLASLVERRGLLADHRIVELGAGKGLLGGVLAALSDTKAVALDRRRAPTTTYNDAHIVADVESCDIEAVVGATGGEKILLLAKHLCGSASDAAVRAAVKLGPRRASLVLAPCCHPQIAWETYAGRAWLEGHGIGEEAFGVLRDVVRATRAPRPEDRLFLRSGDRGTLDARESRRVGVVARRAIEEGRRRALIDAGFAVHVVRYAPFEVTPDRYVLIAVEASTPPRPPPTFVVDDAPLTGCALHTDKCLGADCAQRVAEYLLERHAAVATTAWVAHLPEPLDAAVPGAFAAERSFPVVLVGGDPRRLVAALSADEVLCHRADMIVPFDRHASSAAEVVAALSTDSATRVFCLPRQDEGEVISAATGRGVALSPTQFATTASVLRLDDDQWLFSTLSRAEWDPIAWRVERMGTKMPPFHPWAREAVARLAGDPQCAIAVGDNQTAVAEALAAAGVLVAVAGGPSPDFVVAAGPREETLEALETWCEERQADGIRCLARLRFGGRMPSMAAVARSLQEVYDDVEIIHLLTDAKAERTVVMTWRDTWRNEGPELG